MPQPAQGASRLDSALWLLFRGYLRRQFGWHEDPSNGLGFLLCSAIPPLKLKLDYLARHLFVADFPDRGILLDIGCGNGEFLASASKMGWKVKGVDPDPQAIAACREQGFDAVFESLQALPLDLLGKVDVITSSNCIEHVSDPQAFLTAAFKLLKPDGRIWLSTPNPQGLGIKVFGRFWRGLEPSRHLCVPSQRQLMRMLVEAGYDNIRLLRRGSHGKTIVKESVAVAKLEAKSGARVPSLLRWLAWPVRGFASTFGALVPALGEETLVVARRGSKASTEGRAE
jgi:2-polyprenyl-3-methyl-5-hydroxy-6-metoxy-1,4-benzoquinol methylase